MESRTPVPTNQSKPGSRLVLLTVVSLLVVSCSSDDIFLPALLADPMANYEAEGIELVDSWEQDEGTEWLSGKPVHAKVGRTYQITDQSQVERTVAEVVAFAEQVGWRVSEAVIASRAFQGSKDLPPGPGRLWISFGHGDDHDPDGPSMLRITLDFGTVRFPDTTSSTSGGS